MIICEVHGCGEHHCQAYEHVRRGGGRRHRASLAVPLVRVRAAIAASCVMAKPSSVEMSREDQSCLRSPCGGGGTCAVEVLSVKKARAMWLQS